MYISFKRLVAVPSKDLPPAAQKGAPCYPCWICVDEDGRTLIADTAAVPVRFWDPQKKSWRECSADSVMVRL
jgi:hypothetical protein